MDFKQMDPTPMTESVTSTDYTVNTPPETIIDDMPEDQNTLHNTPLSSSSIPWPGSTFIIRSVETGHVLTLLGGRVILDAPGGRGSIHWSCVEGRGWTGFREVTSGKYLGHDGNGNLICNAPRQQGWEYFLARLRPEGDYFLLMPHWAGLWYVGIKEERGKKRLAKIGGGHTSATAWDFIKV